MRCVRYARRLLSYAAAGELAAGCSSHLARWEDGLKPGTPKHRHRCCKLRTQSCSQAAPELTTAVLPSDGGGPSPGVRERSGGTCFARTTREAGQYCAHRPPCGCWQRGHDRREVRAYGLPTVQPITSRQAWELYCDHSAKISPLPSVYPYEVANQPQK